MRERETHLVELDELESEVDRLEEDLAAKQREVDDLKFQ